MNPAGAPCAKLDAIGAPAIANYIKNVHIFLTSSFQAPFLLALDFVTRPLCFFGKKGKSAQELNAG
jgi:hypothetical protein